MRLVLIRISGALAMAVLVGASFTAARAAEPRPGLPYGAHRHGTNGHDWHVQMEITKSGKRLATLVVYSQECEETGFTQRVKLTGGSTFAVDKPTADGKGRWMVRGHFKSRDTAVGTWQVTRGDCEDGGDYTAIDRGHFVLGNPFEYPPARINGPSAPARAVRHIKNASLRTAHRFDTIHKAEALGYRPGVHPYRCPGLHHYRKHGSTMWGGVLDPDTPQSLVFWCNENRRFTLAAYMYRAPGERKPDPYDNLIQWHRHGSKPSATWMTHVWLVESSKAAWATCAPFNAFAAAGLFRYQRMRYLEGSNSNACSDTDKDDG